MRLIVTIGSLVVLVSLLGCDQLAQLTDYFAPKESSVNQPQAVSQVASSQKKITKSVENKPIPKNVLVQVGNWTMTIEEFNTRLAALKEMVPDYDINDIQANKLLLEELVRQELLIQEAERNGTANNKDVIKAVDEFRRTLLVREMANNIIEGIKVSDEDAKNYYEQNKQDFVSPGQWKLREIIVDDEEEAKSILVNLYKGEGLGFEETAKLMSKSESAEKGGDLGLVTTFEFPKMESAVATLEPGDISNVFKGPEGFYIVKLEEKTGGELQEFENISEDIKQGLVILNQQQAILSFIDDLQKKTTIVINEKLLEE